MSWAGPKQPWVDRDGVEWTDPRALIARWWRIRDEDLDEMPEVSRHDDPQVCPQEYECGCVAVTRITARDRHEQPYEMCLALACGTANCEVPAVQAGTPYLKRKLIP